MKKIQSIGLGIAVLALTALLCSANATPAQEVTAAITGTVTDASGAPLLGATVTAKDVDRGTTWPATTNSEGVYSILRIPVGTYTLKVEAQGFQAAQYPPFTLVLNQTARIDVQMKVGAVSATVEVTGEMPLLQTETTEVSSLVDSHTITTLPLAARNYVQLSLLSPGTTTVNPSSLSQPQLMTGAGRPDINGNREQAVGFLLDGIVNQESKNNEVAYMPNVDAIQEFNIVSQNPGADFGNYAGGVISATIKSGTNNYHGDVFEFLRNDFMNSNLKSSSWANGTVQPTPTLRYNMFGGTVGGPIKKDKLFFFGDYQGMRIPTSGVTSAQVLTQNERNGDFGGLCTDAGGAFNASGICSLASGQLYDPKSVPAPQNGVPYNPTAIPFNNLANYYGAGAESPVAKALFADTKGYPLPTVNSAVTNNITYRTGNNFNSDQGDLRIDYKKSDKDSIFGRYSKMDTSQAIFSGVPFLNAGAAEGTDEPGWSSSVNWTHTFSPTLFNEARFGVNVFRFNQNQTPTTSFGNVSDMLGISGGNSQAPGLVQITIPGSSATVSDSLGLINLWQIFRDTEIQAEDNVIITRGLHTFKTGFQFIRERNNYVYPGNEGALGNININTQLSTQPCTPSAAAPCPTGTGVADFWLGNTAGAGRRDTGSNTLEQLRGNVISGYFQDDWKLKPTVTLNLGIRFEDHTPLYEEHNRVVNFNILTGAIETVPPGASGYGERALYNNYTGLGDWNPRIGIAWSPRLWGGKMVFRGAYGTSSYREGGGSNEELSLNLPYGNVLSTYPTGFGVLGQAFPGAPPSCVGFSFNCYVGQRLRVYDQNFRPALIQQWNFTVERQFSNSLTFQIGYVGQKGTHLLNFEDLAQWEPLAMQANGTLGIAQPGQVITNIVPGPYLGSQLPGATPANNLGWAEAAPYLTGAGTSTTAALVGANMSNSIQRYDALQAVLKERGYKGLDGQLAYTYSKCLSNSPGYFGTGWGSTQAQSSGGQPGWGNIYNPMAYYGPCYYDETHIISGYFTYALPVGKGKQFGSDAGPILNQVIGGWQLSSIITLHSGNALTLNEFGGWGAYPTGSNPDLSGGIGPYTLSDLPNCNGPINIVNKFVPFDTNTGTPAHIQWFDPTNISNPAANTFGTCGVGNVRGPWLKTLDMSLEKGFTISEHKSLLFRIDAFNAFNNAIWTFSGGPAGGSFDMGQSTGVNGKGSLGWITGTQSARQLQLALKFLF